jgi:hypothetical protein
MCVSAHKVGTAKHCICRQNEHAGGFFHSAGAAMAREEKRAQESAQRHRGDQNRTRSKRVAFDLVSKRLQKTLLGMLAESALAENRSWKTRYEISACVADDL